MSHIDRNQVVESVRRKAMGDKIARGFIFTVAVFCASMVIFTIGFILVKGIQPFLVAYVIDGKAYKVNVGDFLFGSSWKVGVAGYGAGYIVLNTIYIAFLTVLLTAPIGIFTALVIVRMSNKTVGFILNSIVELLASIPSVIYGMFGLGEITKLTALISAQFGYQSAGGMGTLTVVLVLTMMSFPTVTMLSCAAIKSVDKKITLGSLALGASRTQTDFKAVLTAARGGIFAGLILGIDRALGEATAVSLVCGNAGTGPDFNLFGITRTLTSTMLNGMSDASGLNYDIRFSIGILLIFLIVFTNLLLNLAKRRIESK